MTEQRDVGRIPNRKLSLSQPALTQPRDFAIARELQRVAGDTVDPGVPDFAGEHWQRGAVRLDCIGNLSEIRGDNLSVGELGTEGGVGCADLFQSMGAAVVV